MFILKAPMVIRLRGLVSLQVIHARFVPPQPYPAPAMGSSVNSVKGAGM